ncbi:GMC oxidoreductase [Bosea caraganae]|uniref:GMC oxidoreductase n=1 Tax=Bosea caraganae TaxID=2763117 RepID=UPI0015F09BFC|nr:GMC oxidoreductase [Bosea caraganae]
MAIFDLAESDAAILSRDAEFCVVGSGLAGLIIAWRLASAGRRVVILESGERQPNRQLPVREALNGSSRHAGMISGEYRGLGGASAHWGGRLIPLTSHDMLARPHAAIEAWPLSPADLGLYTPLTETLFKIDHSSFEADSAASPPLPAAGSIDADVVRRFPKTPRFSNRNLAKALGVQLQGQGRIETWLNASVCDLVLDRERGRLAAVIAASPNRKRLEIRAKTFFFAAGTFETTRLALHLDQISDGRAFAGCEALGRFFQDHLRVELGQLAMRDPFLTNRLFGQRLTRSTRRSIHFELSPAAQQEDGIASAYIDIRIAPAPDSPLNALRSLGHRVQGHRSAKSNLASIKQLLDPGFLASAALWRLKYRQLYLPPDMSLFADLRIEQAPHRQNRLQLAQQRDGLGMPVLALDWSPTEADEHTFQAAHRRFRAYWTRAGFDEICPIAWPETAAGEPARFIERSEDTLHPAGSTRMGTDPRASVVDPFLRCHGVANLSLVSASVFPSSGSANPSLTLLQLALRAADIRLSQ